MPDTSDHRIKDGKGQTGGTFVCRSSGCGRKQDIFSQGHHKNHFCEVCGETLDFTRLGFAIPGDPSGAGK